MAFNNNAHLFGRLVADPVLMTTANQKTVANFTIAVNNPFMKDSNGDPMAEFFDCSAWGKTAETIASYFKKGYRIGVSGRLCSRMVDHKPKDGNGISFPVRRVDILVESFEFVETKNSASAMTHGNSQQNTQPAPVPQYQSEPQYQQTSQPAPAQQNAQSQKEAWSRANNQNQNPPTQPAPQYQPAPQNTQPAPAVPQNNPDFAYDMNAFASMDFNTSSTGDDYPF